MKTILKQVYNRFGFLASVRCAMIYPFFPRRSKKLLQQYFDEVAENGGECWLIRAKYTTVLYYIIK